MGRVTFGWLGLSVFMGVTRSLAAFARSLIHTLHTGGPHMDPLTQRSLDRAYARLLDAITRNDRASCIMLGALIRGILAVTGRAG